jgi:hypothetical protein
MAEVTKWVVTELTKEDRTKLLTMIEEWKGSAELWMPRIGEIITKGRRVEVHFPAGNSRKIRQLLATHGFPTVTAR